MSLTRSFKRLRQKYYAPGSPVRYLRKVALNLRDPGAMMQRSRLGALVANEMPATLRPRFEELDANGFVAAGDEIDPALLKELDTFGTERLKHRDEGGKVIRSFFTDLAQPSDLRADNILIRFALQRSVLEMACNYFGGSVPYLCGVQLLLSHGENNADGKWQESQLWHRDYDDSRMIKLWVYLTDVVDIEDGPFTYIPAPASDRVKNTFIPGRVSDEAMESAGLAGQAAKVYGERLKTFYIDTRRCYHLGSRLKPGHLRYAYVASFTTHASLYPCENGIAIDSALPPVEKLVLSL